MRSFDYFFKLSLKLTITLNIRNKLITVQFLFHHHKWVLLPSRIWKKKIRYFLIPCTTVFFLV